MPSLRRMISFWRMQARWSPLRTVKVISPCRRGEPLPKYMGRFVVRKVFICGGSRCGAVIHPDRDFFVQQNVGGRVNRVRDFCVTLLRTYAHLWLFGCSERQRKQQCLQELPCFFGHGVLGVECSNHSVPTIFFNDLAQLSRVGLFHVWKITLSQIFSIRHAFQR